MHLTKYDHAPRLPEGDRVDLDALIPGGGDLMLEIGPGRGMFALQWAEQHPESRLLALEIRRKLAAVLADRLAAKGFTRARAFAEDAGLALPRLGPDASVAWVAVHFPDPWWKKRHQKRLVLKDGLVTELARLVRPGGTVLIQTDVEQRAEEYRARFEAAPEFECVGDPWVPESPHAPARSNREARAIADGLPVWRMVFRRR
ncbi:MAG: tRNA (guanine-N7)-methyltransferase [Polyangiales bacterium]